MKQLCTLRLFFVALGLACEIWAGAQNFHLLKDINDLADGNPRNLWYNTQNSSFAVVDKLVYFTADDGIHGSELWVSDGTEEGTRLVKDINEGVGGSNIQNIIKLKNSVVFSAVDKTGFFGVWVSDGTAQGTNLLAYIKNVSSEVNYIGILPQFFTAVNDSVVYFASNRVSTLDELWKTDGTVAGTKVVKNFSDGPYGQDIHNLTSFKGRLFFTILSSGYGRELWSSDGTTEDTKIYKDIFPGAFDSHPCGLTVVNNFLLFFATDDAINTKLWQTQGDPDDLTGFMVPSSNPGGLLWKNDNLPFTALGNALYFDLGAGMSKFKPGLSTGVENVTNFYTSFGYTVAGSKIVYGNGGKLWACDSNNAPAVIKNVNVKNIVATGNGNNFFFTVDNGSAGIELWKSDGTASGTVLVKSGFPQTNTTMPSYLTIANNLLFFAANDGVAGNELWKSDGTTTGTALLKDINQLATGNSYPDLFTTRAHIVNNKKQLLFYATTQKYGTELYTTDGTTAGTKMLKDILPGATSGLGYADPTLFVNFKNQSYFFAQSTDTMLWAWKTDGTIEGTQPADSFTTVLWGKKRALDLVAGTNTLYYYITYGRGEIYASNGVSPKHLVLGDINLSTTQNLCTVGDTLFFDYWDTNNGAQNGVELWMTDGTAQNTKIVKDINTGVSESSFPSNFFAYKGKLYFTANDGTGNYLWVSNGSEDGTQLLKKVYVIPTRYFNFLDFYYQSYKISGNKLFFIGTDSTAGYELWVSDGTTAGTTMVKDINLGKNASGIYNMVDVNGILYFVADDGIHGSELWKSNGTAAGTIMVKDITPGITGTNISHSVVSNGLLYFYVDNAIWQSDGTAAGTKIVDNLVLSNLSEPVDLEALGDNLIVAATSYKYGNELYIASGKALPVEMLSFTGSLVKADAQLTWKTVNEVNSDYFTVERSLDGATFTGIGKVMAAGNTTTEHTYNLTDAGVTALGANTLYYRLQQVDKDGKSTYSNIVKLNVNSIDITVGPNPAHNTVYVRSSINISNAAITIADMNGRVLYSTKQHLQAGVQAPVNVAALSAGTYNVSIQTANTPAKQFKVVIE